MSLSCIPEVWNRDRFQQGYEEGQVVGWNAATACVLEKLEAAQKKLEAEMAAKAKESLGQMTELEKTEPAIRKRESEQRELYDAGFEAGLDEGLERGDKKAAAEAEVHAKARAEIAAKAKAEWSQGYRSGHAGAETATRLMLKDLRAWAESIGQTLPADITLPFDINHKSPAVAPKRSRSADDAYLEQDEEIENKLPRKSFGPR